MPEGLKVERSELLDLCHGHTDVQSKLKKAWPMEGNELDEHGGDRRSEAAQEQVRNTNLKGGTDTATYAEARIAKDRPDLYEKVLAEELSPHAAMVEAGFRPRTATFYPDDYERTARGLLKHDRADLAERAALPHHRARSLQRLFVIVQVVKMTT
jgi:hypothetical protein